LEAKQKLSGPARGSGRADGGADHARIVNDAQRRVGSRDGETELRAGTRAIKQQLGSRAGEGYSKLMRRGLPTAACEECERAGERCGMWCEVRPKDESVTNRRSR
jgi:hypothetical protein